ncbi:hypothetical protein ACFL0C_00250 [Patescibacteria group bacterium]
MSQKINERVSIGLIFDHNKRKTTVSKIMWKNRVYKITNHGFHHTYQKGDTLFHIFSVSSDTISFRISLDSSSLIWTLEEIYDQNIG